MQTDPITRIDLASHHDTAKYAEVFAAQGRLHIPKFLTQESAKAIHATLAREVAYDSLFNSGEKVYYLTQAQMASLKPEERMRVARLATEQAAHGFQYFYEALRLSSEGEPFPKPGVLHLLTEFLNGTAFLDFVRTVTGQSAIAFADAQATRYRKGHYLTKHSDDVPGTNRIAAYVLNLTTDWYAHWGGVLTFLDNDGNVAEGYTPTFNALNLFRVPQNHMVSQVASYAKGDRLSVTGWVRSRPA